MADAVSDVDLAANVVVVGAGIAGLVVAHDLARAGAEVTVLEASDRVGGLLRRGTLGGLALDLGAESFATRTHAVPALIADADLVLETTSPRPGGAHLVVATPDGPVRAPLPRRTVLGIPADPLADDVVALIGTEGAARAAAERDLPPLDAAALADAEPSLADLVTERLGASVAGRLVDTLCRSVYSRPAAAARLSELHPGLWAAALSRGYLTDAAGDIAQNTRAGAAVGGIVGGMWRLPVALAEAARAHGAEIRTGVRVDGIQGDADTGFTLTTDAGTFRAGRVVVAASPAEAARLLAGAAPVPGRRSAGAAADDPHNGAPESAPSPAAGVRVVAAAIDHPGLDAFPVGSGVIVDPALDTAAKALTHVTAKWPWAGEHAPAHRHLVRLSARDTAAPGLETAADIAREVALLTGIPLTAADVVEIAVQDWPDAVAAPAGPNTLPEGVHQVGAAAAGTGLASVIPHARAVAARLSAQLSSTAPLPQHN